MNKNKISSKILEKVSVLENKEPETVVLSSNNFFVTKKFLDQYHYDYKSFKFANCFSIKADFEDINILSNLEATKYIFDNTLVLSESAQSDLMHLNNLTEGKYLGQNQTICFIDTGINPHFDFILPKSRIIKFIDLVNHKKFPYDDNGHGTFVAGIACGNGAINSAFNGVSPLANIISIKALNKNGNSNSNVILSAMQWVYENSKAYNIGVVCMSFGADSLMESDPLSNGAEALWKSGITVVAAAGNSGPNPESIKSPGNNPNIITVGALDITNMTTAEFSSRGPTIFGTKPDLLAPGTNLVSCGNSPYPYSTMSGTSVATPIIAGICANLKSRHTNIKNNEIKDFLIQHCTPITGNKNIEGAGYINFENLI